MTPNQLANIAVLEHFGPDGESKGMGTHLLTQGDLTTQQAVEMAFAINQAVSKFLIAKDLEREYFGHMIKLVGAHGIDLSAVGGLNTGSPYDIPTADKGRGYDSELQWIEDLKNETE